jgi:MoaA/NifB/PqqE/SkfB family radical SAM enzyme
MCEYPQRAGRFVADGRTELETDALLAVLDDFAALDTTGMSFFGGEPMMRKDLFELMSHAKRLGMVTNITTNGNFLSDRARAAGLLATGVDLINVSVDGADAGTHDYLRGLKGGYERLSQGIRNVVNLRKRLNPGAEVVVISVLSPQNIDQAAQIASTALDMGADRVGFMPLHVFDFTGDELRTEPHEWLDRVARAISDLKANRETYRIDSSDEYLDRFSRCFEGKPTDVRCFAGYYSLTVDCYGDYFPCDPYIEQQRALGNVNEMPLREFWYSGHLNDARRTLSKCRECYWNCTTELNLAIEALNGTRFRNALGRGAGVRDA